MKAIVKLLLAGSFVMTVVGCGSLDVYKERLEDSIGQRYIDDKLRKPMKIQITPGTREIAYTSYYHHVMEKIQDSANINFPQHDGKDLYGEMVMYIPIYHDGTIYEKDGGPRVVHSSGNPVLDRAALSIVRRSLPFGPFSQLLRSPDKEDVLEIVTRFKFDNTHTIAVHQSAQ